MEAEFWYDKWAQGTLGFHEGRPNRLLTAYFDALALAQGSRIFLPLCGKTRDCAWLLEQGCRVVGCELSEIAIRDLFAELHVTPQVSLVDEFMHFSAPGIDMFVGDFFALPADRLGHVDAVYDRAALVALPWAMRSRYASHLQMTTACAPQLLIVFEYDQRVMDGPPFPIHGDEVRQHYSAAYRVREVARLDVDGKLKGMAEATEVAWLLT